MIRLIGAITGAALALAALLVLVGIPQFKAQAVDTERDVVSLPVRSEVVEPDPPVVATPSPAAELVELPAAVEDLIADVSEQVRESGETAPVDEISPDNMHAEAITPDSPQWYAFWSPFRSEIAAQGFIDQLQRVTGLDYRVVRIKPGVYEVAFAYAEDADITNNLSQISAATGLEMPDG